MELQVAPRVALVDADRLGREALARALCAEGVDVALAVASPEELLSRLDACAPSMVLVDLAPEPEAAFLRSIRGRIPPLAAVVLARESDAVRAERSFREGAAGFLVRRATALDELLQSIRAVARGEQQFPWGAGAPPPAFAPTTALGWKLQRLTPREREVLAHVAAGHDNLKIAALLNISERTVKSHVIAVYRKLDAENRVQLALLAGQLGVAPVAS